jgi:hypothetical protein
MDDFTEFSPKLHPGNIEQEANCFSANLLMPTDDLRRQLKRQEVTLGLAETLSDRYLTTLTATSLRIVEVTHKPAALVVLRSSKVRWWHMNDAMAQCGLWLTKGRVLPSDANAGDRDGSIVDSSVWLDKSHADSWEVIQSVIHMPSYSQTLILLIAESREGREDWLDSIEDSVDQLPHWWHTRKRESEP